MSGFSFLKRKKQQATVKKSGGKPFRRDIQALRAFAVVVVVLYHLWPDRITGGFAGVDIFFVISGFLMTTSIMGRLKPLVTSGAVTVKNVFKLLSEFYARRISRLVPAALVTLSATLVLAYLTNNLTVMITTAKNVIASATFWQNWNLANQSVDYLHADDAATATEHFWSLSVEEQFYLIWPLLLVGATLLTINVTVLYKKQKISGTILPIILFTIVSFAYGYWLTQTEPSIAYFSTPARIWELMLGGIIAFLPVIKNYDLKLLMPHIGLAMCLYSVFFITGDGFPGWHALIPTVGTAMIIWAGMGQAESRLSFDKLFSLKPIQWIGNISYSVYLWHFPLIVLLPLIIHQSLDGSHGRIIKVGIIVITLVLAQLSYMYVEETTRKVRLKLRYIYIIFIVATGLVVGGGFALKHYGTTQVDARLSAMHAAALDESNVCFGARAILHQDVCGNPYGELNQDLFGINGDDNYGNRIAFDSECEYFNKGEDTHDQECAFGDLNSDRTIVIVGDSHATQFVNALDYVGKKNKYRVVMMGGISCFSWWYTKEYKDTTCDERLTYIENSETFKNASFVLLSFLYRNYESVSNFTTYIQKSSDAPVVLMQDTPKTSVKRFRTCTDLQKKCTYGISHANGYNHDIATEMIENKIISQDKLIDIHEAFCSSTTCYQNIGGVPVYVNTGGGTLPNSHITASFSYSIGPLLEQKMNEKGLLN